ncbi:hypothetical protein DIPPA_17538 [Diplonema papillatum]|nr:hypothetical protein DIPPA_17538 [Diplonema papillatum]
MKGSMFLLLAVVFLFAAISADAAALPLAPGGQLNLPSNYCCICMKGGYSAWLDSRLATLSKVFEQVAPSLFIDAA